MDPTVDRVRQLIEASGLPQGEFAQAVGLDAPKLSKSLSGVRRFSSLDLARIGEYSGRSVDWLLGGDEPPLALAARAVRGSSTTEAVDIAMELAGIRHSVHELGLPQGWWLPAVPRLSGLDYAQGSRLAEVALGHLDAAGLSMTGDLAEVIEAGFGIDVAVVPLGDGVDGLAVATPDARLILAAPTAVPYRQRFTIAHELGHLIAGDDQQLHLDEDIFGAASRSPGSERRANAFAAAVLMPERTLRETVGDDRLDEFGFCRLAAELRVSPAALAHRLHDLDLIDGMAYARYKAIPAKRAAAVSGSAADLVADAGRAAARRTPGLLARDTYAAYERGQATLRLYATVLGETDMERLRASLEDVDSDGAPRARRRTPAADIQAFFGEAAKATS